MLAYHNDPELKVTTIAEMAAHREADRLVQGYYWKNGKGCAVGCLIKSNHHAEYEIRFGIPQMLARLEDCIFEALLNAAAQKWPERFLSAPRPGADLSHVGWQFLHWLITDKKVNPGINHPLVKDAIKQCADALVPFKGEPINESAALNAANAAGSARDAARNAALESDLLIARGSDGHGRIAGDYRLRARRASLSAALSARSAAESAANATLNAANATLNAGSATSTAWSRMADKLIELMEAA